MSDHARFEQVDEKRTMSERIVEGKQIFCKHVQGSVMVQWRDVKK